MRVLTFSRTYPGYHPKAGEPTFFVEKIWKAFPNNGWAVPYSKLLAGGLPLYLGDIGLTPKYHTIRAGHRWKEGDWFKPCVWGDDINPKSGRKGPYQSKQIQFAPPIQVKKVWKVRLWHDGETLCCGIDDLPIVHVLLMAVSENDGLDIVDFRDWFNKLPFDGQIICWNESIEY